MELSKNTDTTMSNQRKRNKIDVYLIHSAEEKSYANTLKERLESYDLSVVTEDDTEPGKYHVQGVSSFVQSCSKCLVVLSESSHNSAWCTLELLLALEKSHRLSTMSVVVLRVLGSTKWQFQLALEMLNTVPRIDISSFSEIENEEILSQLVCLLKDNRTMEDILPAGNIAHAQVWSQYTGFLYYVLPEIDKMIGSTELHQANRDRFPLMMYELVPGNCNCPRIIEDIPRDENRKRITLMKEKTGKITYIHAGNTRTVDLPIYRVTDHDGTEYYCVLEIPNVLLGIQKMIQIRTPSKLQDVDVQMHMSKFYYTLAGILNHPNLPGTYHKARVITFNEDQAGFVLAEEILKAVKEDLKPYKQHDTSIPRKILTDRRYDAFVFNHEEDNPAKDEIANFLEEKGLTLCYESDRIGGSSFNFSEQLNDSRWTILVLSKSALHDPKFSHCCFMLVGEFLRTKRLGIIPVLTDAGHEDIPEAIRIVTYTAVDNNRMYLERILTTLRGEMIPYDTQSLMPAGDVAYVLAWNYAVNYLVDVMPGLGKVITETLKTLNMTPQTCREKLYLIIPKSCDCSQSLVEKDERIKFVKTTPETHIGNLNRVYTFDLYKFEFEGKEYHFAGQYPAPVACLRRMYDLKVAGINERKMSSQVEKFCEEITTVLEHKMSEHFTNFCEIVFYDDRKLSLSEELARRIDSP
nr:uncharacterized protein LOC111100289 isoform X3 [Crassostrea virginica]XP_022287702.1 uncharacterized protein LOC111100289 isoform X3 [Crassostrea virginica]